MQSITVIIYLWYEKYPSAELINSSSYFEVHENAGLKRFSLFLPILIEME